MRRPGITPHRSTDPRHFDSVLDHHRQLQEWAEVNPETFEDRAALVGAEIARIEGRVVDAQELYDKAIRAAPCLSSCTTGRLPTKLPGVSTQSAVTRRSRRPICGTRGPTYLRWGAVGKVSPPRGPLSAPRSGHVDRGFHGDDSCTRRAARFGYRNQSLGSSVRRDRFREVNQHAHEFGNRTRGRRTRSLDSSARRSISN